MKCDATVLEISKGMHKTDHIPRKKAKQGLRPKGPKKVSNPQAWPTSTWGRLRRSHDSSHRLILAAKN